MPKTADLEGQIQADASEVNEEIKESVGRAGAAAEEVVVYSQAMINEMESESEKKHHEEILDSFENRINSLNPDQHPPSDAVYKQLPEEVREQVYRQWQMGVVETLNTIRDYQAEASEDPVVRDALFNAMDVMAEGEDLINPNASDEVAEIRSSAAELVQSNLVPFSEYVEMHNLEDMLEDGADNHQEIVDEFRKQETLAREELVTEMRENIEEVLPEPPAPEVEVPSGPVVEMDGTRWGHKDANGEYENKHLHDGTEVVSSVIPEEYRDAKGRIPKDLRGYQHAEVISGYARRESDNKVVRAPIVTINIKKTELTHNEVVTDPRQLRPQHSVVMNRNITTPTALAEFQHDLANAVIEEDDSKHKDERRVRFLTDSYDDNLEPVKKMMEISYADYLQLEKVTENAKNRYEKAGFKVELPKQEEHEGFDEAGGERLNRGEYLQINKSLSERTQAEIVRLRAEGNDFLADQLEAADAGLSDMYDEFVTNYDNDAYHEHVSKEKLQRLIKENHPDYEGLKSDDAEWDIALEDMIAQTRLAYSYKAAVYGQHAEYLDKQIGLMLEAGDTNEAHTLLLNLDKMLEIEAMAHVHAALSEPDEDGKIITVQGAKDHMHQIAGGFLRRGVNDREQLQQYAEQMEATWGHNDNIWSEIEEVMGDNTLTAVEAEVFIAVADKIATVNNYENLTITEGDEHTLDQYKKTYVTLLDREPTDEEWSNVGNVVRLGKYKENAENGDELKDNVANFLTFLKSDYLTKDPAERESLELYNSVRGMLDANEISRLESARLETSRRQDLSAESATLDAQDQARKAELQAKLTKMENDAAERKMAEQAELDLRAMELEEKRREERVKLAKQRMEAKTKEAEELRGTVDAGLAEAAATMTNEERDELAASYEGLDDQEAQENTNPPENDAANGEVVPDFNAPDATELGKTDEEAPLGYTSAVPGE